MAEASFEERTERATGRRRQEAKNRGQVPRSREIPSVLIIIGGISILTLLGGWIYVQLSNLMVQSFNRMGTFSVRSDTLGGLTLDLLVSFSLTAGPVLFILFVVAILGYVLQGHNVFATELIKPDLGKLNVLSGLKRFLAPPSVIEMAKSFIKLGIVGWIAYSTIDQEWPTILLLFGQEAESFLQVVTTLSLRLLWRTVGVMIVLSALDYLFQRYNYERQLRMSKKEVKEEIKQTEGDPIVKSRIRTVQRQLARRRMMAQVPKADVIITNPTHLAVALLYQRDTMEAPQVVAKGAGWVAKKIIDVGRSHQVPVIENKPLARMLYKTVDLGKAVPSTLSHAVAEILAYVYRLKKKTL